MHFPGGLAAGAEGLNTRIIEVIANGFAKNAAAAIMGADK
jgi:hypothetical protein